MNLSHGQEKPDVAPLRLKYHLEGPCFHLGQEFLVTHVNAFRHRQGPGSAPLTYALGPLIAVSSFPSMARGKSMALNSAPTRTTRETMYIQTSRAMAAPSDP